MAEKLNDLAIMAAGTKRSKFVNNSDLARLFSIFENLVLMEDTKKPHQVQVTKSMCFKRLLCR